MILPSKVRQMLIEFSRSKAPMEAVALITGSAEEIDAFVPMANLAAAEGLFELDFDEVTQVCKRHRDRIIAFFHSHPTDIPSPSTADMEGAAACNIPLFLILSLEPQPQFRLWRIFDGQVYPEKLTMG